MAQGPQAQARTAGDAAVTIIDGHAIEPLANGAAYVTSDGVRTYHADQASALRHVERMATGRALYEAGRMIEAEFSRARGRAWPA